MSITLDRIRELHDAHKDAITHIEDIYFSSADEDERQEVLRARHSIDQTYASLFQSYFPPVDERHFEMEV